MFDKFLHELYVEGLHNVCKRFVIHNNTWCELFVDEIDYMVEGLELELESKTCTMKKIKENVD